MKSILFSFLLLLGATTLSAQTVYPWNETKEQKYQRLINLDYSVPDYEVSRPDANVMGWKLAGILQFLEENYQQSVYNQMLAQIRNVQMGTLKVHYLPVDKIMVTHVQKQDSVITITINTFTLISKKEKVNFDLKQIFTNSLSNDETTNKLFSDISKYVRAYELPSNKH